MLRITRERLSSVTGIVRGAATASQKQEERRKEGERAHLLQDILRLEFVAGRVESGHDLVLCFPVAEEQEHLVGNGQTQLARLGSLQQGWENNSKGWGHGIGHSDNGWGMEKTKPEREMTGEKKKIKKWEESGGRKNIRNVR